MKTSFGIIFLLLYSVALIRPVVPVMEYYARMEEYKITCENRARPALHCDGQCVLRKKMVASNPDLAEPLAPVPVKLSIEDFPLALISAERPEVAVLASAKNLEQHGIVITLFLSPFVCDIFHPPLG